MDDLTGRTIDGYHLEALIGRGASADVYRSTHPRFGNPVAVKLLHREFASDQAFVAHFREESQRTAALRHPSIARVLDFACGGEHCYAVEELLPGGTLADRLEALRKEGRRLAIPEVMAVARPLAEALDHAHSHGIVHRGVRPSNVHFHADGRPVLTDFGLAASREQARAAAALLGPESAAYFSPEQARGRPLDARSDVYSFAALLYELLTGRPPFTAEGVSGLLTAAMVDVPTPPSALRPELPSTLDAVLLRALAKQPEQRYERAGALVDAAAAWLGAGPAPPPPAPSPRRGLVETLGAGVALATGLLAVLNELGGGIPFLRDPAAKLVVMLVALLLVFGSGGYVVVHRRLFSLRQRQLALGGVAMVLLASLALLRPLLPGVAGGEGQASPTPAATLATAVPTTAAPTPATALPATAVATSALTPNATVAPSAAASAAPPAPTATLLAATEPPSPIPPPTASPLPTPAGPSTLLLGPLTFGTMVDTANQVTDPSDSLPSGTRAIYGSYTFSGGRDGERVAAVWFLDGTQINRREYEWRFGDVGRNWFSLSNPQGMADGHYELRILQGERVLQFGFVKVGTPAVRGTVSDLQVATRVDASSHPLDPATSFPSGTAVVYFTLTWKDIPAGAIVGDRIRRNGAAFNAYDVVWNPGPSVDPAVGGSTWFSYGRQGTPLLDGEYEVFIVVNGAPVARATFTIAPSAVSAPTATPAPAATPGAATPSVPPGPTSLPFTGEVGAISFASESSGEHPGEALVTRFPNGVRRITASFPVKGVAARESWTALWMRNGTVVDRRVLAWEVDEAGRARTQLSNESGIPEGYWELVVAVGDRAIQSGFFSVGSPVTPGSLSNLAFSPEVDDSKRPLSPTTRFPPGTSRFFATFDVEDVPDGTAYGWRVWRDGKLWSFGEYRWDQRYATGGHTWIRGEPLSSEGSVLGPGTYEVVIHLASAPLLRGSFTVAAGP